MPIRSKRFHPKTGSARRKKERPGIPAAYKRKIQSKKKTRRVPADGIQKTPLEGVPGERRAPALPAESRKISADRTPKTARARSRHASAA